MRIYKAMRIYVTHIAFFFLSTILLFCSKNEKKELSLSLSDNSKENILIITDSSTTHNDISRSKNRQRTNNYIQDHRPDSLNLRDFGVIGNGQNETLKIQHAINSSVGKTLYIPKQVGKFYMAGQLLIPSNSILVFDHEVVFMAADDLDQTHANFEALIRIENAENVYIKGNNALFKMNKDRYKSEHNHIFMINGSSNVTLEKVRANDGGGDGFYVGAYKTKQKYNQNINLIGCKANNNRRQGLSITSVKNFLADNCIFSGTRGTAPASGVDIEPNNNNEAIENVVFNNCEANFNQKRGFMIQLSKFTDSKKKVSIYFKNCKAKGNIYGFASMYFNDNLNGEIVFENCIAEDSKYSGFVEESCSSTGVLKKYISCVGNNNNASGSKSIMSNSSDFYIYDSKIKKVNNTVGNSVFINCLSNSPKVQTGFSINIHDGITAENIRIQGFKISDRSKNKILLPLKLKSHQNIQVY